MKLKIEAPEDPITLYLLEMDVDGERVYKIGITSRKVEDRCLEILLSYFQGRRCFPYCRPKRYRKTLQAFEKEQWLLDYLKEYKVDIKKKFGGSSEFVKLDLQILVELYEQVLEGKEMILSEWELCPVCGCEKKFSVIVDGKEVKSCGHRCIVGDAEDA